MGLRLPRAVRGSASPLLFPPVHALLNAFPKDLLLSGHFCTTLGLWVVLPFLVDWGCLGMSPEHCVWPCLCKLVANFEGCSESSRQHGGVCVIRK